MALAGIICGSIGVALAIIVLIYNLATGNLQKSFEEGFNAGYNFGN